MTLRGENLYAERSRGNDTGPPASTGHFDEEFVRLLKAHSITAWEIVFERHFDRVYRYALGRLLSQQAAEDVAATTFDRALSTIESYSYRGRPVLAWLYGIARNVVNETRRIEMRSRSTGLLTSLLHRENGYTVFAAPRLMQVDGMDAHVSRIDVEHAMRHLTEVQREVLLLRYFAGLTAGEAGQVMGRPETAVYALQARALAALRRQLT
jgi:RNA polymerase sigma-70 factor, ECF subfamily